METDHYVGHIMYMTIMNISPCGIWNQYICVYIHFKTVGLYRPIEHVCRNFKTPIPGMQFTANHFVFSKKKLLA